MIQPNRIRWRRRPPAVGVFAWLLWAAAATAEPAAPWRPEVPARFADALPSDEADERERLDALGPEDHRIERTPHWSIALHVEYRRGAYRGAILEDLHAAFTRFWTDLGVDLHPGARAHSVVFTPTWERLGEMAGVPHLPSVVSGLYVSNTRRSFYYETWGRRESRETRAEMGRIKGDLREIRRDIEALSDDTRVTIQYLGRPTHTYDKSQALAIVDEQIGSMRRADQDFAFALGQESIRVMTHEAAHQLAFEMGLFSSARPPPRWLNEGIATLFEPSRHGFLLETRKPHWGRWANLDLRLREGAALDLERLITDDGFAFVEEDGDHRYDEAWSLVYFLLQTRPTAFVAYLDAIREHGPAKTPARRVANFEARFGGESAALTREWRAFVIDLGLVEPGA